MLALGGRGVGFELLTELEQGEQLVFPVGATLADARDLVLQARSSSFAFTIEPSYMRVCSACSFCVIESISCSKRI